MVLDISSFGFSPDFSPQIESPLYEDVQLPIADKSAIDALHERGLVSSKLSLETLLLCAFVTTVYRTTGQTDGALLYIGPHQSATSSPRTLNINLEPTCTVYAFVVYFTIFITSLTSFLCSIEFIHFISRLLQLNPTTNGIPLHPSRPKSTLFHFVDSISSEDIDIPPGICTSNWIFSYANRRSLNLSIKFIPGAYTRQSIGMFAQLVERTIKAFSYSPDSPLATLPLTSSEDIFAIKSWNNTTKEPLPFKSIGTLLKSVSARLPNNLAVIHGDGSFTLTYSDLDKWTNALAFWLLSKKFGGDKESVIGVWQSRSAFLVVSYLACLKSGCAYMVCYISSLNSSYTNFIFL